MLKATDDTVPSSIAVHSRLECVLVVNGKSAQITRLPNSPALIRMAMLCMT